MKDLPKKISISMFFGFIIGVGLFYVMYVADIPLVQSASSAFFNYYFSPADFSLGIAVACLLALLSTFIEIPSNFIVDFIKNLLYFKFFSTLSLILGFCIALNMQHFIEMDNLNVDMNKVITILIAIIIISIFAFTRMVKEYERKPISENVKLARSMLAISSVVFLVLWRLY